MANYDDFDLDVKSVKGSNNNEPRIISELTWAVSSAVVSSYVTGCTGDCISNNCSTGCSGNTCSACHSYCGGAC